MGANLGILSVILMFIWGFWFFTFRKLEKLEVATHQVGSVTWTKNYILVKALVLSALFSVLMLVTR